MIKFSCFKFIGFLFLTGLTYDFDGPEWYLKELKEKWKPWNKLQYFWLCYRWAAIRNGAWAFDEWFFREGKCDNLTIKYSNTKIRTTADIMPGVKFKDKDGTDRNNKGPYIRYPFDNPVELWKTTIEGTKLITFRTLKGNKRFNFGHCRIHQFKKRFVIVEMLFGWNPYDGGIMFHCKFISRKKDSFAVIDYKNYQYYINAI